MAAAIFSMIKDYALRLELLFILVSIVNHT